MRILNVFIMCIALNMFAKAQGGMTIYSGLSYIKSSDLNMTPTGSAHYGYVIGTNIRLFDDGMHFLFSGEYGTMNLMSSQKKVFFKEGSLTYIKGKAGLGFNVVKLSKKSKLRTKIQANILYINDFDPKQVGANPALKENGYTMLNEAIGGISTGVGLTLGFWDLDLEYEYGVYNIYYDRAATKLNFITVTTGFRF